MRLTNEKRISNWVTGRLQVFFEGSWSSVCAAEFGLPESTVACRQLGLGAGSLLPNLGPPSLEDYNGVVGVFPEVALTGADCKGNEERLLDCDSVTVFSTTPFDYDDGTRGCLSTDDMGLVLACVSTPDEGYCPHASPLRIVLAYCASFARVLLHISFCYHLFSWSLTSYQANGSGAPHDIGGLPLLLIECPFPAAPTALS